MSMYARMLASTVLFGLLLSGATALAQLPTKPILTLEAAKKLGAKLICPGHGPRGGDQLLVDQQAFFVELRKQVKKYRHKNPDVVKNAVEQIRMALLSDPQISRYVGEFLSAQVEKAYIEMGGKSFLTKTAATEQHHASAHSRVLIENQ